MSLTVPDIITQYARGGGSLAFLLDIEPSAVDGWSTKRFATASVTVGSDAYEDATLGGLNRIGYEAKIIQGGNVATLPDVKCDLLNKDKLNEELVTDNIEGRQAVVQMTAVGPNKCLNSSFEKRTGDDFEDWTEVPLGGGAAITAETGTVYDGATACKIVSDAAEGSYIKSADVTWKIGSKVVLSVYARTPAGTATLKAAINVNTTRWYNAGTNAFGMGRVKNTLGTANSTAWQRFTLEMDWSHWLNQFGSGALSLQDQTIYIELWTEANEDIILDAVQIELNNEVTPYQHNRYELDSDDVMTVFTGIVKNPAWSASKVSISLEAWESNKHRDIPKTILSAATGAGWTIPKDSLGKPFPMTYGDFSSDDLTVWDPDNADLYTFARGLLVNNDPDATGGILIYFDRPSMKLYTPGGGVYRLYHFCEDDGRFYEQMNYDDAGYGYDAQEWVQDFANHPRWKSNSSCYWHTLRLAPFMAVLSAHTIHKIGANWHNTAYIIDDSLSTYGYKQVNSAVSNVQAILEPFPFDTDSIIKFDDDDVWIYFLGDFAGTGVAAGDVSLAVRLVSVENYTPGTTDVIFIWNEVAQPVSWRNTPIKRGGGDPAADKLLTQLQIVITNWQTFSSAFPNLVFLAAVPLVASSTALSRLYTAGALIYFTLETEAAAYTGQLYGRTFGTTWNSRKTAANLVESAPEVIESIIREELDAVDANINMTAFDAADTARSEAAAGQLHETKNSMDVIKDICDEYGLLYNIDTAGKHSLINLDWRAVNKHLFLRDWYKPHEKVKVSYTPRSAIINDFILHYDRIQFTDEYSRLAYCNKDGRSGTIGAAYQTKCSNSYAELGNKVQTLELSCDWIKVDATAEAMLKWTIDWVYLQRMIISGELFMNCIDLVLGDIVTVDLAPLLTESFTETARFMVMSLIINRQKSRIAVKLLEVKEP